MDIIRSVSGCGKYMAVYNESLSTLKIYFIDSKIEYRSYNVDDNRLSGRKTIGKIRWELLNDDDSSKIAISVVSHDVVLIYDLRDDEPMMIYQENHVGIEDFAWIPPVIDHNVEGSYKNCKQILIFTRSYLQVKLYSVDTTNILWSLSKPISKSPILHPNGKIWSLVFNSTLSFEHPIIYHFYNFGSQSKLIYKFKLPETILSDFEIIWSKNNWLIYFNYVDCLFGFNLKVFPSLGINRGHSDIPQGDALININWLNEGIEGESPVQLSNYPYFVIIYTDEKRIHQEQLPSNPKQQDNAIQQEGEDLVIVVSNDGMELEIIILQISDFKINKYNFKRFDCTLWKQVFNGEQLSYMKAMGSPIPFEIKKLITLENYLIIQNENSIIIMDLMDLIPKPIHIIQTERILDIDIDIDNDIFVKTVTHQFIFNFQDIKIIPMGTIINKSKILIETFDSWSLNPLDMSDAAFSSPDKKIPYSTNLSEKRFHEETDTFINKRKR